MTSPALPDPHSGQSGDPSMEDILASIRRILSEEEGGPATPEAESPPAATSTPPPVADDVLVLDTSMMVAEPEPHPAPVAAPNLAPQPAPLAEPEPAPVLNPAAGLLAPETEQAASGAMNELVRRLAAERQTQIHSSGPTIEDLVRSELRPMLKSWLDQHLPPLVERLVRAEIERVVGRAAP
jgi:uncharacterized protein